MPQVGQGILKGMGITLRHLFEKKITRQYPSTSASCRSGAAGC